MNVPAVNPAFPSSMSSGTTLQTASVAVPPAGTPTPEPPATEVHHPAVEAILRHFEFGHLPLHLAAVSKELHALAHLMASTLPSDPELTAGLRKLLEAKDCFVRAALGGKP